MKKSQSPRITIPRRSRVCLQGGDAFASGDSYFSILIPEGEGYRRQDYCSKCWSSSAKEQSIENGRTHWRSKVPIKEQKKELSSDDKALDRLMELVDGESDEEAALAFLMALYLERKRRIVMRKELPTGFCYENLRTEEMVVVKKIDPESVPLEVAERELEAIQSGG